MNNQNSSIFNPLKFNKNNLYVYMYEIKTSSNNCFEFSINRYRYILSLFSAVKMLRLLLSIRAFRNI